MVDRWAQAKRRIGAVSGWLRRERIARTRSLAGAVAHEEGVPREWQDEVRGHDEAELRASAQRLRGRLGLDHAGAGYPSFEAALTGMQRDQAARNARMRVE